MMYGDLPRPFFVLAPMDDVTDTVFRQMVASCASPDLFFTEFVNVDGLMSEGRAHLLKKLRFVPKEGRVVVQLWGLKPENFRAVAAQIADGTFHKELGLPLCPVHHSLSGSAFSRRSTEGVVQKVPRLSTGDEKSAAAKQTSSVSSSAGKQDGRCVCGIAGVDLNMGCPAKSEVKSGACAALIKNRPLAKEIIDATREGLAGPAGQRMPISVKTRVGFSEVDMSWIEFLLQQDIDMLSVHGRTRKQMSKVPADWELIGQAREIRDRLGVHTLIVGNGDVMSREQGTELAEKHALDGIMIGRGVFHNPYVFAKNSSWEDSPREERISLFRRHVELFAATWKPGQRPVVTLNKFCKIYIQGFDGAKDLRERLMSATTTDELLAILEGYNT